MVVTGIPKKALIACLMFVCVLSRCQANNENSQSNDTISLSSSQQGKLATGTVECLFTESGIIYTREDILYYFDADTQYSVALCSKGNCTHTDEECDAWIVYEKLLSVYNDRIYYIAHSDKNMNFVIKSRDMMGTDEKTEAELDAQYFGTDAWVYGNYIFVAAYTDVSDSFDAETKESDSSKSILFAINLDNDEVKQAAVSDQIETTGVFVLNGYDGKNINIYRTFDKKSFSYDIARGILSENEKQTDILGGKSIIDANPDGCTYYVSTNGYMYGCNSVSGDIMQLDIASGSENVVYSPQSAGDNAWGAGITTVGDKGILLDVRDKDTGKIIHYFYFDPQDCKLSEIKSDFTEDYRNIGVDSAGNMGFVYSYPVDKKEGQTSYSGKFELRYMSLESFLNGGNDYSIVY